MRKFVISVLILTGGVAFAGEKSEVGKNSPIPEFKALNAEEIARVIGEGEMTIIHPRKSKKEPLFVTGVIVINATPDEVWNVITDFDRYEEFMPQTDDVKVVEKSRNSVVVDYHLKFKFTIISMKVYYRLAHRLDKSRYYDEFHLVKGDIAQVAGAWRLFPIEGGRKTVATYTTSSDLRSMGFLVRSILKAEPQIEIAIQVSTAALVVSAVRDRTEKILSGEVKLTTKDEKKKGDFGF